MVKQSVEKYNLPNIYMTLGKKSFALRDKNLPASLNTIFVFALGKVKIETVVNLN